tara:strand:- start:183 stop:404 length:222 start_codon:yes stop_codon:yes gene_type:complete
MPMTKPTGTAVKIRKSLFNPKLNLITKRATNAPAIQTGQKNRKVIDGQTTPAFKSKTLTAEIPRQMKIRCKNF